MAVATHVLVQFMAFGAPTPSHPNPSPDPNPTPEQISFFAGFMALDAKREAKRKASPPHTLTLHPNPDPHPDADPDRDPDPTPTPTPTPNTTL